jgi:hypothetical protein
MYLKQSLVILQCSESDPMISSLVYQKTEGRQEKTNLTSLHAEERGVAGMWNGPHSRRVAFRGSSFPGRECDVYSDLLQKRFTLNPWESDWIPEVRLPLHPHVSHMAKNTEAMESMNPRMPSNHTIIAEHAQYRSKLLSCPSCWKTLSSWRSGPWICCQRSCQFLSKPVNREDLRPKGWGVEKFSTQIFILSSFLLRTYGDPPKKHVDFLYTFLSDPSHVFEKNGPQKIFFPLVL